MNILTKLFKNPWYGGLVLFFFASLGCFFSIDSYFADKHHANMWLVIGGIVFGLAAVFCLAKTKDTSN